MWILNIVHGYFFSPECICNTDSHCGNSVLFCMYYPESKTFMGEAKIVDPSIYSQMAKKYSHQLRNKIKESYEDFNHGSLKGIIFTPVNRDYIKNFMLIKNI